MARERVLKVKILGDSRDAERAFAKTDKAAGGLSAKFGKLSSAAKLGMAGAGAAVFGFAKSSVEAFVEAEKAQKRLEDAFKRFPKLADSNIKEFRKLNEELAKKTRFDDDATASGQAVLAQFNLTGKQIKQITPLLQDYAAKTGKDLPDAATLLGKALLGNAKALKAIGISLPPVADAAKGLAKAQDRERDSAEKLEKAQKRLRDLRAIQASKTKLTVSDNIALRNAQDAVTEAQGRHAEATKLLTGTQENAKRGADSFGQVVDALRGKVGGFAEKEGTTAAGKLEILKNRFGEVQESIGAGLLPILLKLAEAFERDVLPALEKVSANMSKIIFEVKSAVRLLSGNLGFNMKDTFKNIDTNSDEWLNSPLSGGSGKTQKRKGGGYGMTGSWTDNSVNVTVNGGKSDKETGETVAREVGWARRGWGR